MDNQNAIQNNDSVIISQVPTESQEENKDITQLAIEKIKSEFQAFSGDSKATAVSSYVSTIIQDFCKQDKRFAEVVYKFKRNLSDCCKDIMSGVGSHISDIDVYRSAAQFYFPNSEIKMTMTIDITGDAPGEDEILKEAKKPEPKSKPKSKPAKKTAKKAEKPKLAPPKKAKSAEPQADTEEFNGPIQLSMF